MTIYREFIQPAYSYLPRPATIPSLPFLSADSAQPLFTLSIP